MTGFPTPPNRHPIMASRVVSAYKAYARPALPPRPAPVAPPKGQDTGPRDPFLGRRAPLTAAAGDLPDVFGEEAPAEGDKAIQDARAVMEAMQGMLSQLSSRDGQDPATYKELFVQYKRLSDLVKQDQSQPARSR